MLKGVVISAALTILWIVFQILIVHLRKPRRTFLVLCLLFTATVPIFPLVYLLAPSDLIALPSTYARPSPALGMITGFIAHLLFFFAYVEFFYYVERSVTLRILVEVARRPGCILDDIRTLYRVETMVEERLNVMRENGFIELMDGFWKLTQKGRFFARTFTFFRRILNLEAGQ